MKNINLKRVIISSTLWIVFIIVSALAGLFLSGELIKRSTELKLAEGARIEAEGKRELDFAAADVMRDRQKEIVRQNKNDERVTWAFLATLAIIAAWALWRMDGRITAQATRHTEDIKILTCWATKYIDIAFDKIAEVRREK